MRLHALLAALSLPTNGMKDVQVRALCVDSRLAQKGDAFFCFCGANTDAHLYTPDAYLRGVRLFFAERPLDLPSDATVFYLPDTHRAFGIASHAFFGHRRPRCLIGITGTKGKTTVASYLYAILQEAGKSCAMIGTGGIRLGKQQIPTKNTTPDAFTLAKALADCADAGAEYAILEVSSQAYLQHRVAGLEFDLAIFTNLALDHIGNAEHASFEDYKQCKMALFSHAKAAILNKDDAFFDEFSAVCTGKIVTYALRSTADFIGYGICPYRTQDFLGVRFFASAKWCELGQFTLSLCGAHNVANALAAMAAAHHFGISSAFFARALLQKVAGRYAYTLLQNGAGVVIDYAHNPSSLQSALIALRPFCRGELSCLFGAVGGRSQCRRHEMGKVASQYADFAILTADNPDFEDAGDICRQIEAGMARTFAHVILPDRRQAISFALSRLKAGELLLLAGKGEEKVQRISGVDLPYCDADEVAKFRKEQGI